MSNFYSQKWDRPWLTPSLAKVLIERSPKHARQQCPYYVERQQESTDEQTTGTLVDSLLLGKPHDCVVLDVENYKKKVAQDQRDAVLADGKTPVTRKEYNKAVAMADRLRKSLDAELLEDEHIACTFDELLARAQVQQRLYWGDHPACATEPDIFDVQSNTVLDLKTTGIVPTEDGWGRHVANMKMDIQVGAVLEATGADRFGWLVIETGEPYDSVIHWASPMMVQFAAMRWDRAKRVWADCVKRNYWPGYQGGYIDPRSWQLTEEEIEQAAAKDSRRQADDDDPMQYLEAG